MFPNNPRRALLLLRAPQVLHVPPFPGIRARAYLVARKWLFDAIACRKLYGLMSIYTCCASAVAYPCTFSLDSLCSKKLDFVIQCRCAAEHNLCTTSHPSIGTSSRRAALMVANTPTGHEGQEQAARIFITQMCYAVLNRLVKHSKYLSWSRS